MTNSKKKVLIAAGIYPPDAGGPAVHARAQFEEFPKFGLETGLVALAFFRKWPRGIRHLIYFLKIISKISKYDLVYAHDALGAGIPAFIAARIFRKKFIVRVGGDITWEYRVEDQPLSMIEWYENERNYKKEKTFLLSRWLLRRADVVIVPSDLLSDLYLKYYNVANPKIRVIYNPVPEIMSILSDQEQTIVYASRLTKYKNLSFVLKVLSKIFSVYPDLKFIIMGDGPDKSQLETLAHDLKIEKNIIFTGSISQEEVSKRISSCLFGIAPALTEFNPNYIMQCFGTGKPFLISRKHGLPFKLPEELMFDPRNEKELQEGILELLDKSKYEEAKEKIARIDFKMTWEDNIKSNVKLINSLLSGSN